jgi:hypothetical protein
MAYNIETDRLTALATGTIPDLEERCPISSATVKKDVGRKPKPKSPDLPPEPFTTTKVPAEFMRKANMVVFHRKKEDPNYTLYEYLKGILGPVIEKDYRAVGDEIADES